MPCFTPGPFFSMFSGYVSGFPQSAPLSSHSPKTSNPGWFVYFWAFSLLLVYVCKYACKAATLYIQEVRDEVAVPTQGLYSNNVLTLFISSAVLFTLWTLLVEPPAMFPSRLTLGWVQIHFNHTFHLSDQSLHLLVHTRQNPSSGSLVCLSG